MWTHKINKCIAKFLQTWMKNVKNWACYNVWPKRKKKRDERGRGRIFSCTKFHQVFIQIFKKLGSKSISNFIKMSKTYSEMTDFRYFFVSNFYEFLHLRNFVSYIFHRFRPLKILALSLQKMLKLIRTIRSQTLDNK